MIRGQYSKEAGFVFLLNQGLVKLFENCLLGYLSCIIIVNK